MKKILIQLDTDEHPSTFDAIVAHRRRRRRAAALRRHRARRRAGPRAVGVLHPRPPSDLRTSRCGSAARASARARRCSRRSRRRSSARSTCRRCSTPTAATRPRRRPSRGSRSEIDLEGRRVVIVGAGAVGLRAAKLLIDEGCDVTVSGIPADRFGGREYRRARGLDHRRGARHQDRRARGRRRARAAARRRLARPRRRPRRRRAAARVDLARGRLDRGARRLQRRRAARHRGHRRPGRLQGLRRQAGARRAGHRRAEDEGPQDLHPAAVRDQRRDPRRRRRLRDRQGARSSELRRGPRVAGIDPGTVSFEVCALRRRRSRCSRTSFPSAALGADPSPLVDALLAHGPYDLVLGPAGYGLPLVPAAEVGERELALMVLKRADEPRGAAPGSPACARSCAR